MKSARSKASRELASYLEHMSFTEEYIAESAEVLRRLDAAVIEKLVQLLAATRARGGRLFILGVGGSAANASHAVNDFRKICGMEAYCPTDNVSELTARTNDEGWASVFECVAARAAACAPGIACLFSRWAAATSKNKSARIWFPPCNTRSLWARPSAA